MENSSDALKIAFAIFIFVMAITLTFMTISQAKATADVVLFMSDKTNYYNYSEGSGTEGREVGFDTVISTIYKYRKESFWVTVQRADHTIIAEFNLENDLGTPWSGGIANIDKSINWAIIGVPPSPNNTINGYEVTTGANRGLKVAGKYSVANESVINYAGSTFVETFDEITFTGKYAQADGEKLTIEPGYSKIHIIYTVQ